jgi:glutathione S-transferase
VQLIIATPSPFARKARVAILEKGLRCDEAVDNPWLPQAGVAALNPLGKVPALVLDDGSVVHDSTVIVEYLDAVAPAPRLIPADPMTRVRAKQIEAIADGVCDAVVLIVLERSRAEAMRSADWIARQRRKVDAGLAELERLLAGREAFLPAAEGGAPTLAEIATACALGYCDLRLPEADWRAGAPSLAALSERLEARDSFARTRPFAQAVPPVR